MSDKQEFTLEEILEEQRIRREEEARRQRALAPEYVEVDPETGTELESLEQDFDSSSLGGEPEFVPPEQPAQPEEREASFPEPQGGGHQEERPQEEHLQEEPPQEERFQEERFPEESPLENQKGKKKKKKRRSFFSWRKKVPEFDENEDDMYYGIQLKPIDEYRLDGGDAPPLGEEGYKALFDDSKAIDDEVEENFQRLQKERRRRVAQAVQSAGMDESQIADEFGVVAPMPVTPYAADPYARQHGLGVEGAADQDQLQKAMLQTSSETMELKLNVLNSTIELQKVQDGQPVSEETVERILQSAPDEPADFQDYPTGPDQGQEYSEAAGYQDALGGVYQEQPDYAGQEAYQDQVYSEAAGYQDASGEAYQEQPEYAGQEAYQDQGYSEAAGYQDGSGEAYQEQLEYARPEEGQAGPAAQRRGDGQEPRGPRPEYAGQEEYAEQPREEASQDMAKTVEMPAARQARRQAPVAQAPAAPEPPPRPTQEVPYIENAFQYRSRNIPTHIINADVLQSALLTEAESLQQASEPARPQRRKPRPKKPEEELPVPQAPSQEDTKESIEDYTGPEDARSISNELRGEMHELSMRIMITGVCTVLLTLVSLICRSRLSPKGGTGSWPLAYVILTLVFLIVAIGMCYKTVGNGLKALFSARASEDSGVSVAALAALIQTVSAIFFREDLASGAVHLYALVASALLFINAAGKLTLVRRIHSNFRFVTSREQKYGIKVFDDYNTSLKMTKDCVAEKPLIAYQCKAGFLKRFLELSYAPDPSESSSQMLAPLGLVSSLVLCIASLLISRSVPTAISAFTAACCACVAAANMLSVNLPISRMCKTARRAGGMVVGYEAVEKLGEVNAVIADANELFPTGTVVLAGIKMFGSKAMAENAVMAASALMKAVGGPLCGVFDQVISENEDVLPEVEKFAYESGGGAVGRVDGHTIYVGSRNLLINHRLEAPPREVETQYASGNKNIIYIAVDAAVVALMVLGYSADRRRKNELQRLEDSGISVLVRTTDPNVTVGLVSRLFGIDSASVGILDGQLGDIAAGLTGEEPPRMDAVAATKGRMESMMSLISGCVEQKRTAGMLVAIQTAAVILGFVLVALVACFGAMRQLSAFMLFLFELFWVGVLVLLPRFRR